jgi:hypothetical protein
MNEPPVVELDVLYPYVSYMCVPPTHTYILMHSPPVIELDVLYWYCVFIERTLRSEELVLGTATEVKVWIHIAGHVFVLRVGVAIVVGTLGRKSNGQEEQWAGRAA